jgi:hypothetical protein
MIPIVLWIAQRLAGSGFGVEGLLQSHGFALLGGEPLIESGQLRDAVRPAILECAFGFRAYQEPDDQGADGRAREQNHNGYETRHENSVYQKCCKDETVWQSGNPKQN